MGDVKCPLSYYVLIVQFIRSSEADKWSEDKLMIGIKYFLLII